MIGAFFRVVFQDMSEGYNPLVICYIAIETLAIEIASFSHSRMWIFPWLSKRLSEGNIMSHIFMYIIYIHITTVST